MRMAEVRGGLRLRLTLAICGVSLAVVAGCFFALREATEADLRDRIDQELSDQLADFQASVQGESLDTPSDVTRQARRFIASQGYYANSRIFAARAPGRDVVTNEPELLEHHSEGEGEGEDEDDEEEDEDEEGPAEELGETGLLTAPDGFATVSGEETGSSGSQLAGALRSAGTRQVARRRAVGWRGGSPIRVEPGVRRGRVGGVADLPSWWRLGSQRSSRARCDGWRESPLRWGRKI